MSRTGPRCYRIEHISDFRYDESARGSLMVLRLQPRQAGGQRLQHFELVIDPSATPVVFRDAFGNSCHLFNIHRAHRHTRVHSHAEVLTTEDPVMPERLPPGSWSELADATTRRRHWHWLAPSQFARSSPELEAFVARHGLVPEDDPLASLRTLTSKLHAIFRYEPGSTDAQSPIEHILATGGGVCQDYTHVMIAIARSWGIPSRYVSGYLHREGSPGEQSPAGASHAWAEFLLPSLDWLGMDPTNNTVVDHRHVAVAIGRDYADAAPTRGVVFGGGTSSLAVRVLVREADEVVAKPEFQTASPNLSDVAPTPMHPTAGTDQ